MVLKEIDSKKFRDMVRVATHRIGKNAKFVNSLNVFPVPDGDTGTNMNLTIESGAKAVAENPSSKVGDHLEGKNLKISFNPDYLRDALRASVTDSVIMNFTQPLRPFTVNPDKDDVAFVQLITPVRTY